MRFTFVALTASTAATSAPAAASPEEQLDALLAQINVLAPLLPPGVLYRKLTSLCRSDSAMHGFVGGGSGSDGDSPLRPAHLAFENPQRGSDDERGDAGSARSQAADGAGHDDGGTQVAMESEPEPAVEWEPDHLWPGGPLRNEFDHAVIYNASDAAERAEADGESWARDPRIDTSQPPRDSIGLWEDAYAMYCDYCDLGTGPYYACMAVDMLQQSRIAETIAERQRWRARKPHEYGDGRDARFPTYKKIFAWQWASPLGAGRRVPFPPCVTTAVRKLFPNPVCSTNKCDYGDKCVKRGHYTGFRTAAQSRAMREGRFLDEGVCVRAG